MEPFPDIPVLHRKFLTTSVEKLKNDERILGVAAGGSFVLRNMDEYSDLDLVIIVHPDHYPEVLHKRKNIAQSIGSLLESFTGEHVGEPRLLVCLYGPPLLHVDLKFVSLHEAKNRVEDPVIIWEREPIVTDHLYDGTAQYPSPDVHWIENRFWIWIHYIASKIGRGELFEVIDALCFLRSQVLGPMILFRAGTRPQGIRRIEEHEIQYAKKLQNTVPAYNKKSCYLSLTAAVQLYLELREIFIEEQSLSANIQVESEVLKYLSEIGKIFD